MIELECCGDRIAGRRQATFHNLLLFVGWSVAVINARQKLTSFALNENVLGHQQFKNSGNECILYMSHILHSELSSISDVVSVRLILPKPIDLHQPRTQHRKNNNVELEKQNISNRKTFTN